MSSSSRNSSSRDSRHIIPTKNLIADGTIRLMNNLSYPTDESLEEQARLNVLFRCCIHEWSWYEDHNLLDTYEEVIKCQYPLYMDGAGLSEMGWKFLWQRFRDHDGHFAPMNIIKSLITEIARMPDSSVAVNVESPITDVDRCVLYTRWHNLSDSFIAESYHKLIDVAGPKKKEFLDLKDWQYIQTEFGKKFNCAPTLSQLQARTRIVLSYL